MDASSTKACIVNSEMCCVTLVYTKHVILRTYCVTTVICEKLIVVQLVKKFPSLENTKVHTPFIRTQQWFIFQSQLNPLRALPSCLLKAYFNRETNRQRTLLVSQLVASNGGITDGIMNWQRFGSRWIVGILAQIRTQDLPNIVLPLWQPTL